MEKKSLYAIVAVIVVIVIIIAAAAVILYKPSKTTTPTPTAPTLVSVTPSSQLTTVGSSVQFVANVKG
ncbi:MAG: hypothetical protein RAK23_03000, partial [Thermoplasmata archaeon]|nr:hypothetical protein [Thermoplasmata archaeon]